MYKSLLKWTPAHPIRKPDNILSSQPKPLFKPLYIHDSKENIKSLMSNEYMRLWFKEKAVYDKNTYIREQIIKDECKIKRRAIQRMATYRRPSKNQFVDDYVYSKLRQNKMSLEEQNMKKMKYKPACPKMIENKKEHRVNKVKSKPKDHETSITKKDIEENDESDNGYEIMMCRQNCCC